MKIQWIYSQLTTKMIQFKMMTRCFEGENRKRETRKRYGGNNGQSFLKYQFR